MFPTPPRPIHKQLRSLSDSQQTQRRRNGMRNDIRGLKDRIEALQVELSIVHKKQYAVQCCNAQLQLYKPHSRVLDSGALNQQCIECYFAQINAALPIFDQNDFTQHTAALYTSGCQLPYVAQYCCIVAVGALFLHNTEHSSVAAKVATNAMGQLFDKISIEVLRCITALSLYYIGCTQYSHATIYLSLARTMHGQLDTRGVPELALILEYMQGLIEMHNISHIREPQLHHNKTRSAALSSASTAHTVPAASVYDSSDSAHTLPVYTIKSEHTDSSTTSSSSTHHNTFADLQAAYSTHGDVQAPQSQQYAQQPILATSVQAVVSPRSHSPPTMATASGQQQYTTKIVYAPQTAIPNELQQLQQHAVGNQFVSNNAYDSKFGQHIEDLYAAQYQRSRDGSYQSSDTEYHVQQQQQQFNYNS